MKKILTFILFLFVLVFAIIYSYKLGQKNELSTIKEQTSIESTQTVVEEKTAESNLNSDEVSRIYNNRGFFVNEDEQVDWRIYANKELGISFMVPNYCGEPEINKYYKRIDQTKIVQGTFPQNCPIKVFSAKMPDVNLENDDTSFASYTTRIKDSELNVTNHKGVKAFIKHEYFFDEMGGGDTTRVYFTFNLKSSKYPVVTLSGNTNDPFRKIINSIEIK